MISGKVDRTGGTLKVNGEEKELTSLKPVIGFVPQNGKSNFIFIIVI